MSTTSFADLDALVVHLREQLQSKKCILLYAYNGTGKTRLSMAFKDKGKNNDVRDTLYFNAFTEDLFTWDNDLEGDCERVLKMNIGSRFFSGFLELEMENRIRPLLHRYTDLNFSIDYENWTICFSRGILTGKDVIDNIKISRGEENIFIWCFFLAIVELAMDSAEAYQWVKYIYIDDPISSLDEQNAIEVANQLAQFLKRKDHDIRVVISSHHTLFFNVLWNELRDVKYTSYLLSHVRNTGKYDLAHTGATPFLHHLKLLQDILRANESGEIYTHHFNALRSLMEKSSTFHGYRDFAVCIKNDKDEAGKTLYGRILNVLSHDMYSFYEPVVMLPENQAYFKKILADFIAFYPFNSELLSKTQEQDVTS